MTISAEELRTLISPSSVAVVGASSKPNSYGSRALLNTIRLGFTGKAAAINPRAEPCGEASGYTSLEELPWVPEHVAVAVPRPRVESVLEECSRLGVASATIFSNGYGETATRHGWEEQERLAKIAAEGRIRFLGPNCNGILNIRDRVALTSTRALDDLKLYDKALGERGYAVVSQSGGLAVVNVMWRALRAGVPIQWVASTGNQANIDAFELAQAALEQKDVQGVLVVLEGMPDAQEVIDVGASAAGKGKFVNCLKLGRSAAGAGAAASHTGSVAGEYAAFEALCSQAGVTCVADSSDLYEVAMTLSATGARRPSGGIAMVSISGGNLALMSDAIDSRGLPIAGFSSKTQDRLRAVLPPMCSAHNPLDLMTAVQDPKVFGEVLDALTDDEAVGVCVVVLTLNPPGFLDVVVDAAKRATKPVIIAWLGGPLTGESGPEDLRRLGLPVYETASACGNALVAAYRADSGGSIDRTAGIRKEPRQKRSPIGETTLLLEPGAIAGGSRALDLLRAWDLTIAEGKSCSTVGEAVDAATQLGFPIVAKLDDPSIVHKTERNGVHVGIRSEEECRTAATDLLTADQSEKRVLIQRQVRNAVELLVAARGGEAPGTMIVVGVGGVLVELLSDVTFLFPPFSNREALTALQRLKGYPLLGSFRGQDAVDQDELANWLVKFSATVTPHVADGGTVEVNPLMVPRGGGRPVIVDAALYGPSDQTAVTP